MVAPVDLANVALARIAARSITTLNDATPEARICNRLFNYVRDLVLTAKDWKFATARAVLIAPAGVAAPDPWPYVYLRPTDCLKPRFITPAPPLDSYGHPIPDWNPDGRSPFEQAQIVVADVAVPAIVTTEEYALLVYTQQITDPTLWTAAFQSLFSIQLAAEIAFPITGRSSVAEEMRQASAGAIQALVDEENGQNNGVSRQDAGAASWISARREWGDWGQCRF